MPVSFLTAAQRESYGCYAASPTPDELARFFHISEEDRALIIRCRGHHNRLGFALQLFSLRFLGTFLADPLNVPEAVFQTLSKQLAITEWENLKKYCLSEQRWAHATEIRRHFGYRELTDSLIGFRLS